MCPAVAVAAVVQGVLDAHQVEHHFQGLLLRVADA